MVRNAHKKLFDLLLRAELQGKSVTRQEIIAKTGWKESSFVTYLTKGQLSFLTKTDDGAYKVSGVRKYTVETFSKHLSQSKHRRDLGHNCKSHLARSLLKKSRENMILALELYNRPSLENRLDAFVLLFCTAWEQLVKALLIERDGENSIFEEQEVKGRQKETISLRKALERLYDDEDVKRRNLERIKYYRDKATHLLMPEIQLLISRVFQSGVLNYAEEFEVFAGQPFIENTGGGLMTLVGDFNEPDVVRLKNEYGNRAGADIFDLAKTLESEIKEIDDIKYAIPLDIKLVFARDDGGGKYLAVSRAEEGIRALKDAVIVEKPVDRSKTHPFKTRDAADEINKRLKSVLSPDLLNTVLIARDTKTGVHKFGFNCFLAMVDRYGWKRENNKFHYKNVDPEYHYYSELAVDTIVRDVASNSEILRRAKQKYSKRQKKK